MTNSNINITVTEFNLFTIIVGVLFIVYGVIQLYIYITDVVKYKKEWKGKKRDRIREEGENNPGCIITGEKHIYWETLISGVIGIAGGIFIMLSNIV